MQDEKAFKYTSRVNQEERIRIGNLANPTESLKTQSHCWGIVRGAVITRGTVSDNGYNCSRVSIEPIEGDNKLISSIPRKFGEHLKNYKC